MPRSMPFAFTPETKTTALEARRTFYVVPTMNICDILNSYNPDVPVDREDFDEAWVPLMDLTAEECKVEVNVPVDSASVSKMDFPLRFVDVAPKAFLQIRHAAGISSREYANILGE